MRNHIMITLYFAFSLVYCAKAGVLLNYVDFMTIAPSVLSGLPDPVFGVLTTNPNFTSIVKTALAHAPGRLASRLGYRGFTITLYRGVNHTVPFSIPYQQTVKIGKCEDPVFEEQLLQTALKLHDQHGSLMSPGIVQQIDSDVKACTGRNFINSIFFNVTLPSVNTLGNSWEQGSMLGSVCPSGTPLSHVFCGLAGTGCPSGYYCEVAPNDAYAVCCRRQDYVDFMTIAPSVLSGLPDPVFGVLTTNPNFTSIVKTALAHAPGRLASRLGYRGFTITLYRGVNHTVPFSVPYQQTVTIGKCEDPVFEEQLLQTAVKLHDQHGSLMSPGIVQQIDSDVKACTGSMLGSVCPSGTPLSHVFCGLAGTGCPSGYYCEVAPNDAYAVCCRRQASTTLCGTEQPLTDTHGTRHNCGRGGSACPSNYHCIISPTDAYAVCCPN